MAIDVVTRRRIVGMLLASAGASVLAACGGQAGAPTPATALQPRQVETPASAAKPADAPKSTEAPKAADTAKPTDVPKPTAAAAAAKPTEVAKPTEAPKPQAAAPTPTAAPPQLAAGQKMVTMFHFRNEFTQEDQNLFEQKNPTIKIYFIQFDETTLIARTAAGNPPDLIRAEGPAMPSYLKRKMLRDLTPNFKSSTVIKLDDLSPANKMYWYTPDGMQVGKGNIYGMVKDWNADDLNLWINKKHFDAAGVAIPSDEPGTLTFQQVAELSEKLTKRDGNRTLVMGYAFERGFHDRLIEAMLHTVDQSLWESDYSKIHLTTPEAKKIMQWYFDLDKKNVTFNPLNPVATWVGEAFTNDQVAIVNYGNWFASQAESDKTRGNVLFLPMPKWGPKSQNACVTPTGQCIMDKTKLFDETWKLFEYYCAGEPAIARAKTGWGVPALKSLYSLMPEQSAYQKQYMKVLRRDLDNFGDNFINYNPFIRGGTASPFRTSYNKNLEAALRNQITFDQMLQNVEKDVNDAIKEGMAQYQ